MMTPSSSWCRSYTVCAHKRCANWIWADKLNPGARCRKCGTWWQQAHQPTGKGDTAPEERFPARPRGPKRPMLKRSWTHHLAYKSLGRSRRARTSKRQADLLATTWDVIPGEIQSKLQALGFGPPQPEEPGSPSDALQCITQGSSGRSQQADPTNPRHGEGDCPEVENPGHRPQVHLHQEDPATGKARRHKVSVCCHAAGHARAPNKADGRTAKVEDPLRAVHEGCESKPNARRAHQDC